MANFIEASNLNAQRFVNNLSRYSTSDVAYYHVGTKKYITFPTYKKQVSNISSDSDLYMVVYAGVEYRPDIVSKNIYGTVDFWWKILEANNIKDIFEFKIGLNIRIPQNVF